MYVCMPSDAGARRNATERIPKARTTGELPLVWIEIDISLYSIDVTWELTRHRPNSTHITVPSLSLHPVLSHLHLSRHHHHQRSCQKGRA